MKDLGCHQNDVTVCKTVHGNDTKFVPFSIIRLAELGVDSFLFRNQKLQVRTGSKIMHLDNMDGREMTLRRLRAQLNTTLGVWRGIII